MLNISSGVPLSGRGSFEKYRRSRKVQRERREGGRERMRLREKDVGRLREEDITDNCIGI
jgi:hypothetical protein